MKYFDLVRPRNLINSLLIFLTGSAFYWRINGFINNLLGLIGFLLIYAAVYIFNDLKDLVIDKNHYVEWKRNRPLVKGVIKPFIAKRLMITYLISGLIISLLVNQLFFVINSLIILINFTYSGFQLKNHPVIGNSLIMLVQLIKLLSGWFSNGLLINGLPLIFFIAFSFEYSFIFTIYKRKYFNNKQVWKALLYITSLSGLVLLVLSAIINPVIKEIIIELLLIIIIGGLLIKYLSNNFRQAVTDKPWIIFLFNFFLIICILIH